MVFTSYRSNSLVLFASHGFDSRAFWNYFWFRERNLVGLDDRLHQMIFDFLPQVSLHRRSEWIFWSRPSSMTVFVMVIIICELVIMLTRAVVNPHGFISLEFELNRTYQIWTATRANQIWCAYHFLVNFPAMRFAIENFACVWSQRNYWKQRADLFKAIVECELGCFRENRVDESDRLSSDHDLIYTIRYLARKFISSVWMLAAGS